MKAMRASHWSQGLIVLMLMFSGLTACSTQAAPAGSLQVNASVARSIKVYESPT